MARQVGQISIRVMPDLSGFHSEVRAAVERVKREHADIDVGANTAEAEQEISRAARDRDSTVHVKADTTKAKQTSDLFAARMRKTLDSALKDLEPTFRLDRAGEQLRREIDHRGLLTRSLIDQEIDLDLDIAAGQRTKVLGEVEAIKRLAEERAIHLNVQVDEEGTYRLHKNLAKLRDADHRQRVKNLGDEFRARADLERQHQAALDKEAKALQDIAKRDVDAHMRRLGQSVEQRVRLRVDTSELDNAIRRAAAANDRLSAVGRGNQGSGRDRVREAWRNDRSGIASSVRALRDGAEGYRRYNAGIRENVNEMQRQRPLMNRTVADFQARIGKLREVNEALRLQQRWMRENDRSLTASQARWKSWTQTIRESSQNAANAMDRFRESHRILRRDMDRDGRRGSPGGGLLGTLGGGGGGGGGRGGDRMFGNFRGVRNMLPKFGSGMNLPALILVASILPPIIAMISGLLVTLPGALMGILGPIGAVALGFQGIGKALEKSGLMARNEGGDPVVGKSLQKLMDAVGKPFEDGLTPIFTNMVDKLFPRLEQSVPKLAEGMTTMFGSIMDTLTSEKGMGQLDSIFINLGKAFENAAPGMGKFTDAFMTLADRVVAKFPSLGDRFTGIMEQFANWADKVTTVNPETGLSELDEKMSNLRETLSDIGGLIGDIFSWGWDNLGGNMGEKIKGWTTDLRTLINETLPGLETAFKAVASTLGPIATTLNAVNKSGEWLGGVLSRTSYALSTEWAMGTSYEAFKKSFWGTKAEKEKWNEEAKAAGVTLNEYLAEGFNSGAPLMTPEQIKERFPNLTGEGALGSEKQAEELGKRLAGAANKGAALAPKGTAPALDLGKAPEVVKPPDTNPAKQKLAEYDQFVSTITAQVKGSLSQAMTGESLPAPNFEAFKAAWSGVAMFVNDQVTAIKTATSGLSSGITTGLSGVITNIAGAFAGLSGKVQPHFETMKTNAANALNGITLAATTAASNIASAFASMGTIGTNAGAALMQGVKAGIDANVESAKASATTAMEAIRAVFPNSPAKEGPFSGKGWVLYSGQSIGEGFGQGLEQGFAGVTERAKSVMQRVADAMASGVVPDALRNEMKQVQDQLKLEYQELKVQKNAAGSKEEKKRLSDQMAQVQALKDQLKLDGDRLGFAEKYGDEQFDATKVMQEQLAKTVDIGKNFAMANANQMMGDLGIPGGGALSTIADTGLSWATGMLGKAITGGFGGTTINVNSVDEALAAKQTLANKQALQFQPR